MEQNEMYPIEEFIMTKNRAYSKGRQIKPTGIQVHSVGCKGTNRNRWRRWNDPSYEKCPNAFVDTDGIMQTLPWNQRPWLSGKGNKGNANDWCVGFEICEPSRSKDTPLAAAYLYGCVRWLCFELCKEYGISPDEIKCHKELHRLGFASNHEDVMHWWGKRNTSWDQYTMNRLRKDVKDMLIAAGLYEEPAEPVIDKVVPHAAVRKGSVGSEVTFLQNLLTKLGYEIGPIDGVFGSKTQEAVKKFQKKSNLKQDGIVGPQTWAALQTEYMNIKGE